MNQTQTTTRNATLEELASLLKLQHESKLDVVVPAGKIRSVNGVLHMADTDSIVTPSGVSSVEGKFRPTVVCDEGIASKLQIPTAYLKRLRAEHIALYDTNVNGWLADDERSFLVRCFNGDEEGIARAFLSNTYKPIDYLDGVTALLSGIRQANTEIQVGRCDLTERKMYVYVEAPQIQVWAGGLLAGYRDPRGGDERKPYLSAGLVFTNSEVGLGAWTVTPRFKVLICKNGMTITKDAMRAVHLGSKLEEGVIRAGQDTLSKELELITLRTRDAVTTFLDADYMRGVVSRITEKAEKPLGGKVDEKVRTICKKLKFSEQTIDGVLDHFIRGGQTTAGGVMQAVTSYAQDVEDADLAHELEASCEQVLDAAVAV